jgi:S-formylglutathione hydrolase FrmB
MSLIHFQFYSTQLKQNTAVDIILPTAFLGAAFADPPYELPKKDTKFRTVYLLHGITGDHSEWHRGSQIEFTALQRRLAVVTPDVGNSFGKNLPNGANYENFLAYELPDLLESHFPLSPKREDRAIAGLSMGGYSAFRTAFAHPDIFGYTASLSGAVNIKGVQNRDSNPLLDIAQTMVAFAFGENGQRFDENKDDLLASLNRLRRENQEIPKIFQAIGTEDFIYAENRQLGDDLKRLGFQAIYEEGPGAHDFAFWNTAVDHVLAWFASDGTQTR